jgi:hypothetical protein
LRKIPDDPKDAPDFGRTAASMVVTLSIYNRILLRRVFSGEIGLGGPEPVWFADTVEWLKLPKRQPHRRTAERTMRRLIESLNQQIGALDEATLMVVPIRAEEIPEFLTLSIRVQSHLAWYLDVEWFPRMFTFKPPEWVKDLGNEEGGSG